MSELETAFYHQVLVGAGLVLVVAWISVSLLARSRIRSVFEWIGAIALYTAVGSIFARLFHRFWIADNEALMGIFGFLLLVFGAGLVVSIVNGLRAMAGHDVGGGEGATH